MDDTLSENLKIKLYKKMIMKVNDTNIIINTFDRLNLLRDLKKISSMDQNNRIWL